MTTLAQSPPPATHPTYPPTTSDLPPLIPSSNQPLPPAMPQSEPVTLAVTDHDHDLDRKMKESPRSSMDDMAGEKAEVVHTGVEPVMTGPKLNIRFLMMTGQSQVYSFHADDNIGKVKDLVWTYWPSEWQTTPGRPAASNYFRLLFMGKQLADNESLSTLNLRTAPAATIIHLAIRPFPPAPEETPKKSLLPFSLPTLPRPGGSRQNSANVPLVSPSLATTNANTGSVAPAGGGGNAGGAAGTAGGAAAGAGAASGARTGAGATGGAAGTNSGQTRARGGEDSHGGGCKCVIM